MKYYEMEHRATLGEAFNTRREITKEKFDKLKRKYTFYGYDDRINCNRYILKNLSKNWGKYSDWLLEEKDIVK